MVATQLPPAPKPAPMPPGETGADWIHWIRSLFYVIQVPDSAANEDALLTWMAAENPPKTPSATWNPLNSHQFEVGSKNHKGRYSEQDYPDEASGLKAVRDTLAGTGHHYEAIVAALRQGTSATDVLNAVQASGWAQSQYAGGLAAELPGVQAHRATYQGGFIAGSMDIGNVTPIPLPGEGIINGVTGAAGDLASSIGAQLTKIAVLSVIVLGGVALVVGGAYQGASPATKAKIGGAAGAAGKLALA